MAYIPNTLDFDENGRAIIEIPKIQRDYSFILNHWQSPQIQLKEIESDLLCPDSEERKMFLEKARRLLLESSEQYTFDDNDYDEVAEQAKIDEAWRKHQDPSQITPEDELEETKRLEEEFKGGSWEFSEREESEEEREYNLKGSKANIFLETDEDNEYENPQYLIVYNFHLKHSLAWYMMNRIDNEIILIEQQIEKEYGALKIFVAPYGIDEFIKLARQSPTPFEAYKAIMEYFQLTAPQADFLVEMKLRDIAAMTEKGIVEQIEFYNFIISLLKKMK